MKPILICLAALSLFACGAKKGEVLYSVTLTNTTANQPLSPPRLILHKTGAQLWQVGHPASDALEKMAESGNASELMLANYLDTALGDGVLMPGRSVTFELMASSHTNLSLSVATMLVNTNDAFAGITDVPLSKIKDGQSISILAPIFDAGTEENSELKSDIPGPAAGGEGYNSMRDDVNVVAYHSGVVSHDDGLSASILDASHKFDQGAVTITLVRRQ